MRRSAKPTVIGTKKMKFRFVQFIKNDTLAVGLWQPFDLRFDKTTKTFVNKLYFTDLTGSQWHEPLQQPPARSATEEQAQALSNPQILDNLPNDPAHVLVVNDVGTTQGDIYRVDVKTARAERIQRGEEKAAGYVTDLEGNVRARLRLDNDSKGAYIATELRDPDTGAWEEHFRSYAKDRDVVEVVTFSKDPNIAYVLSNVGRDKAAIYEYNIREHKLGNIVFQHKFFDVTGIGVRRVKDADFGKIQYYTYAGPRNDDYYYESDWYHGLDQQLAKTLGLTESPQLLVDPATGDSATVPMRMGLNWMPVSVSQDRSVVIFAVESPTQPLTYFLLHDQKLTRLATTYPDIDPRAIGTASLVYYKARDGLEIPAFLHTPNPELCGKGPWKAVIHPHGGPWARDALTFDYSMWIPLMTSHCMAVLQPQYRGSQGWGRRLWMAGDAEWGQKMQDDKDDGARWLIDQQDRPAWPHRHVRLLLRRLCRDGCGRTARGPVQVRDCRSRRLGYPPHLGEVLHQHLLSRGTEHHGGGPEPALQGRSDQDPHLRLPRRPGPDRAAGTVPVVRVQGQGGRQGRHLPRVQGLRAWAGLAAFHLWRAAAGHRGLSDQGLWRRRAVAGPIAPGAAALAHCLTAAGI